MTTGRKGAGLGPTREGGGGGWGWVEVGSGGRKSASADVSAISAGCRGMTQLKVRRDVRGGGRSETEG